MKKFSFLLLVGLSQLFNSCSVLGIGKQCYTCTTQISLTATGVPKPGYDKEICGDADKTQYIADNKGLKNGVYLITTCTPK